MIYFVFSLILQGTILFAADDDLGTNNTESAADRSNARDVISELLALGRIFLENTGTDTNNAPVLPLDTENLTTPSTLDSTIENILCPSTENVSDRSSSALLDHPRLHAIGEPPTKMHAPNPLEEYMTFDAFFRHISDEMHRSNPSLRNMGSMLSDSNRYDEIAMLAHLFVLSCFSLANSTDGSSFNRMHQTCVKKLGSFYIAPQNIGSYTNKETRDNLISIAHLDALTDLLQLNYPGMVSEVFLVASKMMVAFKTFSLELADNKNLCFGVEKLQAFKEVINDKSIPPQERLERLKETLFYIKRTATPILRPGELNCRPQVILPKDNNDQGGSGGSHFSQGTRPINNFSTPLSRTSVFQQTQRPTAATPNGRSQTSKDDLHAMIDFNLQDAIWQDIGNSAYSTILQDVNHFVLTALLVALQKRNPAHNDLVDPAMLPAF